MSAVLADTGINFPVPSASTTDVTIAKKESCDKPLSLSQRANETLEKLHQTIDIFDNEMMEDAYERIDYYYGRDKAVPKNITRICIVNELLRYANSKNKYIAKDAGNIYVYNGEFWIMLEEEIVKQFLSKVSITMGQPKHVALDGKFAKELYEQILHAGFFTEKEEVAETLINVLNGTLWIGNNIQLKEFDYKNFQTHQLNFEYNPNVTNQLWLNFLEQVLPDENTRKTLQQALGSLLVRGVKLEKAIFLYGTGSNGKSVIFEVLNGIIGEDNISNYSINALTDEKGYHRAKIQNKLINYGTDIDLSNIDPGVFKTLASGEPIEARLPYKEPFILRNYARMIFNLNKIDNAKVEDTNGFFRRILMIPFEVTIKPNEQDKDLHKKILQNKAGVLNWILEGAKEVITNQKIYESEESSLFVQAFKKESNSVARFINKMEIKIKPSANMPHSIVYNHYSLFCKKHNIKAMSKILFSKEMKKQGFDQGRNSTGNTWKISLTN